MTDRKTKTSQAIRRMLTEQDISQLSLFEVSDNPLREAIFEQNTVNTDDCTDEEEK